MTGRTGVTDHLRRRGRSLITAVLLLGVLTWAGLLFGAVAVDSADVYHAFSVRLGLTDETERLTDSVIWAIRFPRVLAGLLVGASLAVTGAALQGAFRNHMADPHLVGIAPAAGLGAIAGIAASPVGSGPLLMMIGAAIGGILAGLVMRAIALRVVESTQFILVGLAVGLGVLAWLGAIVFAWDSPRVPTFTFWVFGGLSGSTWSSLRVAAPMVIGAVAGLLAVSRQLDLLALGESEAKHLGVDVNRLVLVVLTLCGVAIGGAVGLGGVIGFVGLVVPLVVRRVLGPDHKWLLGMSALFGGALVVAVDTVARTVAAPIEIPVGLLTAIVGAPVFLWFLTKAGRSEA